MRPLATTIRPTRPPSDRTSAKPSGRRRKFDFFLYCTFQSIILISKGHTGANADELFHLISSSSRIDKRLRLSRSTLWPQLTAECSSHWDTAMLRGGGDNANIWISIESHKDGCYENNQLTPAFNSLTAVYNNTQCCHRNTAC